MVDHHHQFSYSSSSSSDTVIVAEWESGLPSDDLTPLSAPLLPLPSSPPSPLPPSLPKPSSTSTSPPSKPFPPYAGAAAPSGGEATGSFFHRGQALEGSSSSGSQRRRLVWTPHLHKPFVNVTARLGSKEVVPKEIMEMMNVEGLTREHVAFRLQKYQMKLKESSPCN